MNEDFKKYEKWESSQTNDYMKTSTAGDAVIFTLFFLTIITALVAFI
jgi:hypothetical protein